VTETTTIGDDNDELYWLKSRGIKVERNVPFGDEPPFDEVLHDYVFWEGSERMAFPAGLTAKQISQIVSGVYRAAWGRGHNRGVADQQDKILEALGITRSGEGT